MTVMQQRKSWAPVVLLALGGVAALSASRLQVWGSRVQRQVDGRWITDGSSANVAGIVISILLVVSLLLAVAAITAYLKGRLGVSRVLMAATAAAGLVVVVPAVLALLALYLTRNDRVA